jgi:hypothetical protein
MKAKCNKEEMLDYINKQLDKSFTSKAMAAAAMNQSPQLLGHVLRGDAKEIPAWLLDRFGYRTTVVYERIVK